MKNYFIIAAAALAVAASCAKVETSAPVNDESFVTFTAQLPEGLATKSISDGTTATVLDYYVYEVSTDGETTTKTYLSGASGQVTDFTLSTTVSLKLVTGKTYDIIFWAHAQGAPYTVNTAKQTVTVDYTSDDKHNANDENRDAFYKMVTITVEGSMSKTVKLTRPFAQINVATDDYADAKAAGTTVSKSSLKVGKIYTTLNLADGTVSNEKEVNFDLASIPTETIAINGTDYTWLEMSYILVDASKSTVDCEITFSDGASYEKELKVTSVPVQRNYRTNIYGSLLTNDATFNVNVSSSYTNSSTYYYVPVVVNDEFSLRNAIMNGGEVKLESDITITSKLLVNKGQEVTVDLNGHNIINATETTKGETEVFSVSKGTLNIKGDGDVQALAEDSDNDGYREVVTASGTGVVNIYGGSYYNKQKINGQLDLIYATGSGQINIYGGTFESGSCDSNGRYWVLNRKNGTKSTITVYGGTFKNFDPANPNTDDDSTYVADGYASTSDGSGNYTVAKSNS